MLRTKSVRGSIEAMSLLTAAIVTRSCITVKRCPIDFLELELLKLEEKMGLSSTSAARRITPEWAHESCRFDGGAV